MTRARFDTTELIGTHQTKRTDLGGQCGRSTDLTSGSSEVDDLSKRNKEGDNAISSRSSCPQSSAFIDGRRKGMKDEDR